MKTNRFALSVARKQRDKALQRASEAVMEDGSVSSWGTFREAVRDAESFGKFEEQLRVTVRSEPRTYGPANPANSFFKDVAAQHSAGDYEQQRAAKERLERNAKEVSVDEPKRYANAVRDTYRNASQPTEVRAVTTSSMAGFTTPTYFVEQFSHYNSPYRTTANACTALPLPDWGTSVHVPSFTSDSTVAQQTQNSAVSTSTPSGADITTSLVTVAGGISISQQLHERGGAEGLSFDEIVVQQATGDLDAQVDSYVLTQIIANAGTITDTKTTPAGSAILTDFYSDVMNAATSASAAGVNRPPTHLILTNTWCDFLLAQTDSTGRPLYEPDSAALVAAAGDPDWLGWSGFHIARLGVYTDDNIPSVSSNTQVLVTRPSDALLWESEAPIVQSYPETSGATLSVWVGFRKYVAAVVRHAGAHQAVTGARYAASPTFVQV